MTRPHDPLSPLLPRPPWVGGPHCLCSATRLLRRRGQHPCQRLDGNASKLAFLHSPRLIDVQMFLGGPDKVYIIDKVEGNPTQINGHPAFASVWSVLPPSLSLYSRLLILEQGPEHAHRNSYRCPDQSLLRCWHASP